MTGQADHGASQGYSADSKEPDEPSTEYPKAGQVTSAVPLAALRPADSPRLIGEDAEHIRVLAEPDRALPPILVHRSTMRIIDGMHRLGAARLRGQNTIDVVFFDGSEEDAFVLAVKANVAHGLPLSYADREAAVARIVISHPDWSDRAIAAAAGLGPRTVATVRGRIDGLPQGTARLGRDGKVRPLDSTDGRRVASRLIAAFPDASLRSIARAAGIAPATVRDVRERIQRGEDPVPPRRPRAVRDGHTERRETSQPAHDHTERLSTTERNAVLRNLERDPSLRFAQTGTRTLRWLVHRVIAEEEWRELVDTVPPHSVYVLAALARRCANEWIEFAHQLEQRVGSQKS
ncbi:streptomycin biosynthesis protein [Amycolatopsis sp. WAC 01376]|uniref:ParB/RepB/Spo0J family partition protein n=1 Tax=Amycolatopsis sp. WAC 01376 TaxID=2203195 RepID=UPI000F798BD7|nr:ParB N-terminal domain-containing protein [Amycolatopsis sp. WAC 01376]RSM56171.1 streptomycin biosynthesis protein [Amycolatopsis sp. WAC 01376]